MKLNVNESLTRVIEAACDLASAHKAEVRITCLSVTLVVSPSCLVSDVIKDFEYRKAARLDELASLLSGMFAPRDFYEFCFWLGSDGCRDIAQSFSDCTPLEPVFNDMAYIVHVRGLVFEDCFWNGLRKKVGRRPDILSKIALMEAAARSFRRENTTHP